MLKLVYKSSYKIILKIGGQTKEDYGMWIDGESIKQGPW